MAAALLLSRWPTWSGGGPGPDAVAADADATPIQSGLIWGFGALDFAGGTVVHINAGIAALVGALILGPRKGYRTEPMPPHSLTLTLVGAGLLWVGWFGFNAGSNLEANGYAALAMINTLVATAAAGLSWVVVEWVTRKKASHARPGLRPRRRPGGHHPGRRLRRSGGRHHPRPGRQPDLRASSARS